MCFLSGALRATEIYKYKDENGVWRYSDKKPAQINVDTVEYKNNQKKKLAPRVFVQTVNKKSFLVVENIFNAPLEVLISSSQFSPNQQRIIVAPQTSKDIFETEGAILPYTFKWQLGDPTVKPNPQVYDVPVDVLTCPTISQGFHGKFSHHDAYNQYAVDIALPVGTYIKAAQEGVVIEVKDDYYMGGTNDYFMDKANFVRVMHRDNTFAIYYHILLGSALVKVGDKVRKGTQLARSGSSGFSSGPHLHFAIEKNIGFREVSIPFNFIDKKGETFIPEESRTVCN